LGMAKKGSPKVHRNYFKIGVDNPKVVSSSLTPATMSTLWTVGLLVKGGPTVFRF
jgi:hypothetical protein